MIALVRDVIFASRWVDDGEGAALLARARAAGQPVFAWGQDLGASLAVAVVITPALMAELKARRALGGGHPSRDG